MSLNPGDKVIYVMSQAFGKFQILTTDRKSTHLIEIPAMNLVLSCELLHDTNELVLVVRSTDGAPLSVRPSAANTVGILSGATKEKENQP